MLPQVRQDWANHFIYQYFLTLAVATATVVLSGYFNQNWDPVVVGGTFGVLLAAAKELIHDKWMNRGVPSPQDFLWGCFGTMCVFIPHFLIWR